MDLTLNVLIEFILTITLLQHRCYGMLLGYACLFSNLLFYIFCFQERSLPVWMEVQCLTVYSTGGRSSENTGMLNY